MTTCIRWMKGITGAVMLFTFTLGNSALTVGKLSAEVSAVGKEAETAAAAAGSGSVTGQPQSDPLLQQGLTIHEIDKEVERLRQEEKEVEDEIGTQEVALKLQEQTLKKKSESAKRVLQAYYMGDRDQLWLMLFQMDSLSDMLVAFDYLNAVVRNDFRVLRAYRTEYQERLNLLAQLEQTKINLQSVIEDFLRQRSRLVALQADLDRKLAQLTAQQQEQHKEQIAKLTSDWESEGLPLFRTYLSELGAAMEDISELLSDESRLTLDGADLFVRITEEDFNAFLQTKSELFKEVKFQFTNGQLVISSSDKDSKQQAVIEGKYELEEEPENLLRFRILTLRYNGFTLPDTTSRSLEEQFDLSFRPSLLFAGLKASGLQTDEGLLEVKLTITGFPLALGGD